MHALVREIRYKAIQEALECTELRFPELRRVCQVFREQVAEAKFSDVLLDSLYRQIQHHGGFL